jgi:prepilin signal peptidase PulO-like enzyme (type II secretory pathway)
LYGQDIPAFVFELIFSFVLLSLVVFDLRWKLLPVEIMAGCGIFFALWSFWMGMPIASLAVGIAFGVAFLLIQVLLSRGKWMGSGDPWLGGMIGAALGWPLVGVSFYLTYLIGGAVALFLLTSGLAKRNARVPFAPMLSGGALLAVWFGARILSAVASFFG